MPTVKTISNFTINKGLVNELIFTIKKDQTLLPIIIDPSDTFKLVLFHLDTDSIESEINMDNTNLDGFIEVYDAPSGRIMITLNTHLTNRLIKERGPKVDKYYLKPTYRIAIDCDTVDNGKFVIKLRNVSID